MWPTGTAHSTLQIVEQRMVENDVCSVHVLSGSSVAKLVSKRFWEKKSTKYLEKMCERCKV